jgi:hypothetical protein
MRIALLIAKHAWKAASVMLAHLVLLTTFVARHIVSMSITLILGCACWTLIYLLLLINAIIFHKGLGGPLAYPVGLLFVVVPCLAIGMGIIVPSCGIGVAACRLLNLPRLAAIPFVFGAGAVLTHAWFALYIEKVTTHQMPAASTVFWSFTLYLSLPLGAYWWLVEGPYALIDGARRLLALGWGKGMKAIGRLTSP